MDSSCFSTKNRQASVTRTRQIVCGYEFLTLHQEEAFPWGHVDAGCWFAEHYPNQHLYVGTFVGQLLARSELQRPPTHTARYRIEVPTTDVTDDIRIPYGKNETENFLEPICRDIPEQGIGGGDADKGKGLVEWHSCSADLGHGNKCVYRSTMGAFALKESINRHLDDGVRKYEKRSLAAYGAYDWARIESCLKEWEGRGLLKILKPISEAEDDDIVIEMLDYIDQKSPWPNWPPKKQ